MKTLTLFTVLAVGLASPAFAQAPVLAYSTKGEIAYLDLNPPGGKAPAVKLACPKGSGEVDIAEYEAASGDQSIKLSSGAVSGQLDAKKSSGSRGDYLRAHTQAGDKVLAQFRQSGQLDIAGQGFTTKVAATSGDAKRDLEQFFIACAEREGD